MIAMIDIRPALRDDVPAILGLIRELAEFEKLTHLLAASEADIDRELFGERPVAEALVARTGGNTVAFALYFHNMSTFLGRRGLWLEDLYVRPDYRRAGIGEALLRSVARIAAERGCGRFEWTVLDWNQPAIDFYRKLGADILPDWRVCRVTGPALAALAHPSQNGSKPRKT